jgi:hypothetical protein
MGTNYLRSLVVVAAFLTACGAGEPPAGKKAALTAVNEKGKTTTFSAEDLAKLPRQTVKVKDPAGNAATYEGVSLAEVLRAANVTLGKDLKGPLVGNCLVVQAADGYKVVFSLPEIDPELTDRVVLLADRKDDKPLDAKEGPYRLVVPHEKRPVRWVRQVTGVAVQKATDLGPEKKGGPDAPKPAAGR